MRILEPLMRRRAPQQVESRYSLSDYLNWITVANGNSGSWGASVRPDIPDANFVGYVESIHNKNGVVSAAVTTRANLLSEVRLVWRDGRRAASPGRIWVDERLTLLNGFLSADMKFRLEQDVSYAGNAYVIRDDNGVFRRLQPDRVTVLLGSNSDPSYDGENNLVLPYDAEIMAYLYIPVKGSQQFDLFMPEDVAHWMPEPDPIHFWRGSSWVTSVVQEIVADGMSTQHVKKFFENAATPNLVFTMDPTKTPEETREYADIVNRTHAGSGNAFKNMFLGGGTDVKVVGSTLETLGLKDLTGGMENRVALRSRVPAVILGVREGLSGSSLNQGNYNSSRRLFADGWFAPTANSLCQALSTFLTVPRHAELTYDPDAVMFLQEDRRDAADILSTKAATMRTLIDGGFDPESVIASVASGELARLEHSGNLSVQLHPEGVVDGDPAFGQDGEAGDDEDVEEDGRSMRRNPL